MKKEVILSASRVKTLETCSWTYWCNYVLKIPQKKNEGAQRGTICHLVFELLLNKKHKKHFTQIMKGGGMKSSRAVDRLVIKHLKKEKIYTDENYKLCSDMIFVGLNADFFGDKGRVGEPELKFLLESESPRYKVMGFIDKTIKYSRRKKIKIVDYKSSKYKFRGEELDCNIQAMTYTLAAKELWPKLGDVMVEFLFLKYPRKPQQQIKISEEQLRGFEFYLEHIYQYANNFSETDANNNYAKDDPKTSWLCKAGKTWRCPYLDPQTYYALVDKDGTVIKCAPKKSMLPKPSSGNKIEKKEYKGCPAHEQTKEQAKEQAKGQNTKDDFDF